MTLSRRDVLKLSALVGAGLQLSACEKVISGASERLGQHIPETLKVADGADLDPIFHLLSRAGYGPWPGELERVKALGAQAWINEQLEPEKIDDNICNLRARRFETLFLDPGTCYDFKKTALRADLTRHTLLRAVYSKRQLFEAMVSFWTDHLNIYLEKGDCIYLKPSDDRLVIRAHALGKFKDMIRASAISPAMLVYLDGKENKRAKPSDVPNENYARELLELHTLGVDGGYTQRDVFEVARCLTGWRLHTEWQKGIVYFDKDLHDDGEKHVLGSVIPAHGQEKDLDRVVNLVCHHPSTARHIARKLVSRFVRDDPPQALVERTETVFRKTDGDIKEMMRTILTSQEFANSSGKKFKRPFQYIASCLRIIGADTHAHEGLVEYLTRMGQGPFQYPTPDGYPEETAPWMGTLLWRWNFAFDLVSNQVPSVNVALDKLAEAVAQGEGRRSFVPKTLFEYFVGRAPSKKELAALNKYVTASGLRHDKEKEELLGLILASPAFQRC